MSPRPPSRATIRLGRVQQRRPAARGQGREVGPHPQGVREEAGLVMTCF